MKIKSRIIYIPVIVVILLLAVFFVLKYTGLPTCKHRGYAEYGSMRFIHNLGLCPLLAKTFPQRDSTRYKNGNRRYVEVRIGADPHYAEGLGIGSEWGTLNRGSYYDPTGQLISTVRNGSGVGTFFYENGQLQSVCVTRTGRDIYGVMFYEDGSLRSVMKPDSYDSEGYPVNSSFTWFYNDGKKRREVSFHKGKRVGSKEWYENGQLKNQKKYDDEGKEEIHVETFDVNGKRTSENTNAALSDQPPKTINKGFRCFREKVLGEQA